MIFPLLNNSWVVGIGGGVLSGLVVAFISRVIFSRKDNKEYNQKVVTANQEIFYAIRPGISEKHIPSGSVIESIIFATAKKYKIESWDLLDSDEIADSLIKEVMDSSFISVASKSEYCEKLVKLKEVRKEETEKELEIFVEKQSQGTNYEYRQKMLTQTSTMLGLMTALMTVTFYFIQTKESSAFSFKDNVFPIFLIMIVGVSVPMIMHILINLKRELKEKVNKKKDEKDNS